MALGPFLAGNSSFLRDRRSMSLSQSRGVRSELRGCSPIAVELRLARLVLIGCISSGGNWCTDGKYLAAGDLLDGEKLLFSFFLEEH